MDLILNSRITNHEAMNKVYEFWYSECIHESGPVCISLHKTKKGAEMAMLHHKEEKRKEHEELKESVEGGGLLGEYDKMSAWGVRERVIHE